MCVVVSWGHATFDAAGKWVAGSSDIAEHSGVLNAFIMR